MTDRTYETIRVDRNAAPGVTFLVFNRPEKHNAMSPQMHEEVTEALEWLRADDETRVLVLTGAGESFCAGMDLKRFFMELRDHPAEFDRILRLATEWRGRTLRLYPKPTISMINGFCFGGAFSIVEGTDIAIAAEDAVFGLSEINFEMFPAGSLTKSLTRILRPRDPLFYAMTGRPFNGRRAADIGLVNYAVPLERLRDEILEVATQLTGKNPHALRAIKEAFYHSGVMDWDAAMSYAQAMQKAITLDQQDSWRDEGIGGFLDKRYRPGLEGRESSSSEAD